jgi:tetratricopeptide (TPR) repeat protein
LNQPRLSRLIWGLLALFSLNCSSYKYWEGKSLLDAKNYDVAIVKLLVAESHQPDDFRPKRDLGLAYFHKNELNQALKKLLEARRLKINDGLTAFYLGQTYEALRQYDSALAEYTRCHQMGRFQPVAPLLKKRIRDLLLQKISAEIKTAVADENLLDLATIPENSMAVLYYKNINNWKQLDPLEKGLAQMLITDLSKVRALRLVERLKLQQLLQEIHLTHSDLFAPESVPRFGKFLGARKIIKGGFLSSDEGEIQIITAIVETRTGEIVKKEIQLKGGIHQFFELEKKLVFEIARTLGIELSFSEREAIQQYPTQDLLAFLAYAKGLDYEDQARFDEAREAYLEALTLDSQFEDARERAESLLQKNISPNQLSQMVIQLTTQTSEGRLIATGQQLGQIPQTISTESSPVMRPGRTGTVIIKGELPVPPPR